MNKTHYKGDISKLVELKQRISQKLHSVCIECTGPAGVPGMRGATGSKGPIGATGAIGATGVQVINRRVKRQAGCPGTLQYISMVRLNFQTPKLYHLTLIATFSSFNLSHSILSVPFSPPTDNI